MLLCELQSGGPQQVEESANAGVDVSAGHYGNYPLIQSHDKPDKDFIDVRDVDMSREGQSVWLRGRMFTSRMKGESLMAFDCKVIIVTIKCCVTGCC